MGGSGRSAPSFPLWKQCTFTAAPAALFALQGVLNRISSACAHKVCTRARLKTGTDTYTEAFQRQVVSVGVTVARAAQGHLPLGSGCGGCPVSSPVL